MGIGSVLLGIALLTLVGLYLARPFLKGRPNQQRMTRRQNLLAQKEVFLDQIRSLDFDHDTGKIPDEVYQSQRSYLLAEASEVLKELDQATARFGPKRTPEMAKSTDVDDEIEQAIVRFRGSAPAAAPANGKRAFCTQCGQATDPGDRFCAHCGHELPARQPA
jgi:hypothetical protein